jgi:hypothetical protein
MRLKQFVTAVVTPAVLMAGVLLVALVHFHNTLSLAEQSDLFARGVMAYNSGQLQVLFQRDAGAQRPLVQYGQQPVLAYTEWSSSVVVDGQVYSLWDQQHGYSFDDTRKRIFSAISGQGWQVVQVVTVGPGTIAVAYSFDYVGPPAVPPHEVGLILVHEQRSWLDPTIVGATFRAGVTSQPIDDTSASVAIRPQWKLAVTAAPAGGVQATLHVDSLRSTYDPLTSASVTWASQFTTTYTLATPQPNVLTPLATESVTVAPMASPSG